MVNRQRVILRLATAVLTHKLITLEQIASTESDTCIGQPIVTGQRDDFRDAYLLRYRLDERLIVFWLKHQPVAPVVQLIVARINDSRAFAED